MKENHEEQIDTINQHIKTEDIINKLTENEKYYIKLHIANHKNIIMSVKTNWDEFETNKEIMKEIRKSLDYILLYLQVVLQNDKIHFNFRKLIKNI